jgi:hypothetical protein
MRLWTVQSQSKNLDFHKFLGIFARNHLFLPIFVRFWPFSLLRTALKRPPPWRGGMPAKLG